MFAEVVDGVGHLAIEPVKVSPDFQRNLGGFFVVVRVDEDFPVAFVQCLVHFVGCTCVLVASADSQV